MIPDSLKSRFLTVERIFAPYRCINERKTTQELNRLGHSKVSITLNIYGHLMPEMQNEAADLMDELVTPVVINLHQTAPELHQDR